MQFYYLVAGRQVGPISWDALVLAGRSGTFNASDLVWAEGWPSWQPAGAVPGLLGALPVAPGKFDAPRRSLGDDPMMRLLLPVGRSGWAIAAGYLGLFAFLVLPAPLALVAGLLAIMDIKRHPKKHGMGRAVFGVLAGALGSVILLYALLTLW